MTARNRRLSVGPVEVYAYHDYRSRPWSSPLYAGLSVAGATAEVCLSPESPIRLFSGEGTDK